MLLLILRCASRNKNYAVQGVSERSGTGYISTAVEILYCSCVNQQGCPQRQLRLRTHAMRPVSIIAVLLLVVANALELLPVASPFQPYLSGGALVLGLVALVTILFGRGAERDIRGVAAEAARPMPIPTAQTTRQTPRSSAF
jgi:hypothetical protein